MVRTDFTRLTAAAPEQIQTLLNEPRNFRHMPLAGTFTIAETEQWIRAKDEQWDNFGYGPWAVWIDGSFAGWTGFQHEENGADFALVLLPLYWGRGKDICIKALQEGFGPLGIVEVLIAFPPTRNADAAVARLGFVPDGEVTYGGATFQQYRLTKHDWAAMSGVRNPGDIGELS